MRANEDVVLVGPRLLLVPYKQYHVPTYHDWMKSPFLRETTASEPLTLQEEYAMQQEWLHDEQKLTFILLSPTFQSPHPEGQTPLGGMLGDVNLFLSVSDNQQVEAEVEIMIAEALCRGQGLAKEALQLMLAFTIPLLNIKRLEAKIGSQNAASLVLFQERMEFTHLHFSEVFQEYTLERPVTEDWMRRVIEGPTRDMQVCSYQELIQRKTGGQ